MESKQSFDKLGFTLLEVAQLLGKTPFFLPVKFQDKGQTASETISVEELQRKLNFIYRPYLHFHSYEALCEAIANCPYLLRYPWLAIENHALTARYRKQLREAFVPDVSLRWIDAIIGYGIFAESDLPKGTYVGEYTGLMRRVFRREPDINAYCFQYPTKFWSLNYLVIDALPEGNLTRFINHSDSPNTEPICLVDRGLLHQVLVATRPIKKGEQLTFDYGVDYWQKRTKVDLTRG